MYPNWLQNHYENVHEQPGAISVVNIQYWRWHDFWGVMPRVIAYGEFDLLNYALPLALAKKMNVFGRVSNVSPMRTGWPSGCLAGRPLSYGTATSRYAPAIIKQ